MLLRWRVTIIVSITYALMVAGLTFAGLKSEDLANERYGQATLNGQEIFWRKLVENTLQRLEAAAPIVANNTQAGLADAVARRSPAAVREIMEPLIDQLRQRRLLTRWEVVSSDNELLYSSTGSLLDPPLIDAGGIHLITESRTPQGGITQSADHGYIAAWTFPLVDADVVVGAVTLAADLQPPLDEFRLSTGSDVFLVDRAGRLVLGTNEELGKRFDGTINVRTGRMETRQEGKRSYALVVLPLHDSQDRVIGALATLRDFTETQAQQDFIRQVALASVGGFLVLVLLTFTIYLRRSFNPLSEAIQVLNALSRGDTSVSLEVGDHHDEIGRIAGAVGIFRDNAIKLEMLEQRRDRQRRRQELFIRLQMQKLSEMLEDEARAAVLADLAEIEAISNSSQGTSGRGEIEVLAKAFQTMSDRIREQHEYLQSLIADRTRDIEILREALRTRDQLAALRQELDFARELQLSSLPQVFPPFPERDEFQIHAAMIPAKEVGGDFYDFFFIDNHHLGFVIGDASGKGVPAAMFIAITRSLIKSVAPLSRNPAECLAFVNTMLAVDNPQLLFATAFYGVLDTTSGEVAFCNAGHPPPVIIRADGEIEIGSDSLGRDVSGVALGVVEDREYETGSFKIALGDTVLLYTDGVTEAMDSRNFLFEEGRLLTVAGTLAGAAPADVIARVEKAVAGFVGDAPQFDDITMLSLRLDRFSQADDGSREPMRRRLMLTGFTATEISPDSEAIPSVAPVSKPVSEPAPSPELAPAASSPEPQKSLSSTSLLQRPELFEEEIAAEPGIHVDPHYVEIDDLEAELVYGQDSLGEGEALGPEPEFKTEPVSFPVPSEPESVSPELEAIPPHHVEPHYVKIADLDLDPDLQEIISDEDEPVIEAAPEPKIALGSSYKSLLESPETYDATMELSSSHVEPGSYVDLMDLDEDPVYDEFKVVEDALLEPELSQILTGLADLDSAEVKSDEEEILAAQMAIAAMTGELASEEFEALELGGEEHYVTVSDLEADPIEMESTQTSASDETEKLPTRLEATILNDLEELNGLAGRVQKFLGAHHLPERVVLYLNLCLDELITNTISYGYDDGARHDIFVSIHLKDGNLITEIIDDSKEYNPFTQAPKPDLLAEVEERQVGGLGVFLVKEFNDSCEYRRDDGCNVITLVKNLE